MCEMSHAHREAYNHFEDDQSFYLDSNLLQPLAREKQFIERIAAQYFSEAVLAVEYLRSHAPPIITVTSSLILFCWIGKGGSS